MQRRGNLFPIFLIFGVLSVLLFIFSQNNLFKGVTGFFEQITVPIQSTAFGLFHPTEDNPSELKKLREENNQLRTQFAKHKELEKDNKALRDQFETTTPAPKKLLPARIIGMVGFVPGGSPSDKIIIDKGESDGVTVGDIVVVKDNLVGKVIKTSPHMSGIYLLTDKEISFTGTTTKTSVTGVVKGIGGGRIFFGNVVLADKLEKNDTVTTKGDVTGDGGGYPPDLIVGKIISVSKKDSALFQTAELKSLVDFSKLRIVFVMTN